MKYWIYVFKKKMMYLLVYVMTNDHNFIILMTINIAIHYLGHNGVVFSVKKQNVLKRETLKYVIEGIGNFQL